MKFKLSDISSMKYGSLPKHKSVDGQYPIFTGYKTSGYSDEFNVEDPEIVVVARGVGGTGDVKMAPGPAWITNLSIIVRVNPDLVNKKYLQLKLAGMGLRYLDSGSAQSQITIKDLSEVKIDLPDLDVQTKVAKTIQMFEDKISNLQAINDNLLALTDLYVTNFVSGIDNKVPLSYYTTGLNGHAFYKDGYDDYSKSKDQYFVFDLGNIDVDGNFRTTNKDKYFNKSRITNSLSKFILGYHDLVMIMTDRTQEMGILGKTTFITKSNYYMLNQRIYRLRPIKDSYLPFVWAYLNSNEVHSYFKSVSLGTTQKYINTGHINNLLIPKLEENAVEEFSEKVLPILNAVENNQDTLQTLTELRDELIDSLIN